MARIRAKSFFYLSLLCLFACFEVKSMIAIIAMIKNKSNKELPEMDIEEKKVQKKLPVEDKSHLEQEPVENESHLKQEYNDMCFLRKIACPPPLYLVFENVAKMSENIRNKNEEQLGCFFDQRVWNTLTLPFLNCIFGDQISQGEQQKFENENIYQQKLSDEINEESFQQKDKKNSCDTCFTQQLLKRFDTVTDKIDKKTNFIVEKVFKTVKEFQEVFFVEMKVFREDMKGEISNSREALLLVLQEASEKSVKEIEKTRAFLVLELKDIRKDIKEEIEIFFNPKEVEKLKEEISGWCDLSKSIRTFLTGKFAWHEFLPVWKEDGKICFRKWRCLTYFLLIYFKFFRKSKNIKNCSS